MIGTEKPDFDSNNLGNNRIQWAIEEENLENFSFSKRTKFSIENVEKYCRE